jgi:hypothetical protein
MVPVRTGRDTMKFKTLSIAVATLLIATTALAGRVDETASNDAETYYRDHPENGPTYYLGHEPELAGEYASKYAFENETQRDLYVLVFKSRIEKLIAGSQGQ